MQNKYEVIGVVGEGAYGIVYKCKNKETGKFVAIKKFKEVEDEIVKKTMKRELKMLQRLNNPNVVDFQDAFRRKGNLFLVFEFCEKNLLELLQENPKGLEPNLIRKFIFQLCKAIKYLHNQNIIHRDIKPENLLITDEMDIKLCDFGFARLIRGGPTEKLTDYVATRWYRAPELLLTQGVYGKEIDYWAIGCIMGELVDGNPLFPGESEIDQIYCIQKVLGNLTDEQVDQFYSNPLFNGKHLINVTKPETLERIYLGKLSKKAIHFMKCLLELDPKKRLDDETVFQHPYLKGLVDLEMKNQIAENNNVLLKTTREDGFRENEVAPKKKISGTIVANANNNTISINNINIQGNNTNLRDTNNSKEGKEVIENNYINNNNIENDKKLSKNSSESNSTAQMLKIKIVNSTNLNFQNSSRANNAVLNGNAKGANPENQNYNKIPSNTFYKQPIANIHIINDGNYCDDISKNNDNNISGGLIGYDEAFNSSFKKKNVSKDKSFSKEKSITNEKSKSKERSREKQNKMATSINFNQKNKNNLNLVSIGSPGNNSNNNIIDNAYKTFYKKNKEKDIYNIELDIPPSDSNDNMKNYKILKKYDVINEEDEFTQDEIFKLKQLAALYKTNNNGNNSNKHKAGNSQNNKVKFMNKNSPPKNYYFANKNNYTKNNFHLPVINKGGNGYGMNYGTGYKKFSYY